MCYLFTYIDYYIVLFFFFFFFQAEDGIRDYKVTGVQTCALPIFFKTQRMSLAVERRRGRERLAAEDLVLPNDVSQVVVGVHGCASTVGVGQDLLLSRDAVRDLGRASGPICDRNQASAAVVLHCLEGLPPCSHRLEQVVV